MKTKVLFTMFTIVCLMVGCKSSFPVAQQSGKEDMAYLVFVGSRATYGSKLVQVDVDGTTFDAKVIKPKTANRKGTQYGVATGRRNIIVKFKGNIVYSKQLFLSSQETKTITLP